jgi:hypothetical protein
MGGKKFSAHCTQIAIPISCLVPFQSHNRQLPSAALFDAPVTCLEKGIPHFFITSHGKESLHVNSELIFSSLYVQ